MSGFDLNTQRLLCYGVRLETPWRDLPHWRAGPPAPAWLGTIMPENATWEPLLAYQRAGLVHPKAEVKFQLPGGKAAARSTESQSDNA